jgi:hypothetical protein
MEQTRKSLFTLKLIRLMIGIYFLGGVVFNQEKDQKEKYKIVLRIKLRTDVNPLIYMDEPKSGIMHRVNKSSRTYVDLVDKNASQKMLFWQENEIKDGANIFSKIKYDRKIYQKKKRKVQYNYFSSSFGED